MLSSAYFVAKFRFDTAENEPAKTLQNFANFPSFANIGNAWKAGRGGAVDLRGHPELDIDVLVGAQVDPHVEEGLAERRDLEQS